MHRFVAAILVAGACASSPQAYASPPEPIGQVLTLEQALRRAVAASPGQDAAAAGIKVAAAQLRVANLRPNPSVVAETENVGGTGIYRGVRASETTVGLALPIELGGKRWARVALADAQAGRALLAAAIAQADLRLSVVQAYNGAAAAQRRATVAREQVAVTGEALRAAQVRVKAGRASPFEAQRADIARLAAEGAAERADRSAGVATANLERLIGGVAGPLDSAWFERVAGYGPPAPLEPEGSLAAAAARSDFAAATAQVRLARSQSVPDITLSASARRLEETNDTAAVFGLAIPLPLFNSGRAGVDVAVAQREQADALRRLALLDAAKAIADAQVEAANAATTARNATGPALAGAREAARIARIGYREGKFGQLDLIDAERTLFETRQAAVDALAAYHDARARFERLTTPAPITGGDDR